MKIELNRDGTEFLCALISRRVRFLLVGGHAVAGHGEPRLTEDLDLFVEPTLANARRLRAALIDLGVEAVTPPAEELAEPVSVGLRGLATRLSCPANQEVVEVWVPFVETITVGWR